MQRELTYSCDRLPAFASISKTLASVAGQQFLGGIWNGDRFLESLCWRVTNPRPGTRMPHLPSWSWGSVDGAVSFDAINRSGRGGIEIIPGAKVESFDVKTNKSMSRVSGSITIKSKLCRKTPLNSSLLESAPDIEKLILQHAHLRDSLFLDHPFESIEDVYAINVLSFPRGPRPKGYGYPTFPQGRPPTTVRLILQRVRNGLNVFRRVGIGIYPGPPTGIQCKADKVPISPLSWIGTDQEELEGREIVIV